MECERSIVGTQVTCVCVCVGGGGYENGTDMYGGVLLCLSVVVPTPRLVRILCALSAVSLRLCAVLARILGSWSGCGLFVM